MGAITIVSGALFALSIFVFADAVALANQSIYSFDHIDFVFYLPLFCSWIGFALVCATNPSGFGGGHVSIGGGPGDLSLKELLFFVVGWSLLFGSTLGAIVHCGVQYTGHSRHQSAFPGVASVMQTCLVAMATATFWAGKKGGTAGAEFVPIDED